MAATKLTIQVNGKDTIVSEGTSLLEALRKAGAFVPTLCNHKSLTPSGSCRLCICEIEDGGPRRMVNACSYPVRGPLQAFTDTERVLKNRRLLLEMYLGRYPEVPLIQGLAKMAGVTGSRFTSELTETAADACVLCGHCVRACEEFALERILDFAGRGIARHIDMPFGEVDPHCVGCTSCGYTCPTGAIKIVDDANGPVDPEKIRNHGLKVASEMATLDKDQCRMREVGTGNIVEVMDAYDLLPCLNFKFGSHPDAKNIYAAIFKEYWTQGISDGCWKGCSMACAKAADHFELKTGPYKGDKVTVDGPEYETAAGCANMGCFDAEFALEFNFYCDTYGVDTISVATGMAFVMECYEAGIIDKEYTGGLELPFGASDAVLTILHQMAEGEGFGVEVGQGILWLKTKWIAEGRGNPQFIRDIGMEVKGLEFSEYVSKESLAQQGGYSMANKGPQHDEAWLIFMDMVNNQLPTFEDKAEGLYYYPLWRTWFGLWGLCKLPWNDVVPTDNHKEETPAKVSDHVRNYFRAIEGLMGIDEMTEAKMLVQSGRVHNLQRVLSYMLGKGTAENDDPPYRAMGPVTVEEYESRAARYDKQLVELIGVDPEGLATEEKMAALRTHREEQYATLKAAVYQRRGWDEFGVPTRERLRELGIDLPEILAILETGPRG
ncbi:MAG: aldehyde ferredoxin oxidoreductase C-terminal domain-containing protein [Pseudomonadota bacterium]